MPDYHPFIARAVSGLATNSPQARQVLYEQARNALVAQLRLRNPQISAPEMMRERVALEAAIRQVEEEASQATKESGRPRR